MVIIQQWLNTKCPNKNGITKIEWDATTDVATEGELKIENWPDLEEINLSGAKVVNKFTISNCPGVEVLNLHDNKITEIKGLESLDELKELIIAKNQLQKKVDLSENLKLETFICFESGKKGNGLIDTRSLLKLHNLGEFNGGQVESGNPATRTTLDKATKLPFRELEIYVNASDKMGVKSDEDPDAHFIDFKGEIDNKAESMKRAKDYLKNLFNIDVIGGYNDVKYGSSPADFEFNWEEKLRDVSNRLNDLPPPAPNQTEVQAEVDKYKSKLHGLGIAVGKENANDSWENELINKSQLATELSQAEKDLLKFFSDQLGLGLTVDNISKEQVLDKIKEKKPDGPVCSHSDYDTLKAQRDNLQAENNRLKEENGKNKDSITRKALVNITNTNLENWGINSDEKKQKIQRASSANEVEKVRNEIIKNKFSELKGENDSSAKLNIALGALAIGNLLLLFWLLMRQTSLPQTESEKDKEK